MPFTHPDRRNGSRADLKIRAERKARRWVLRELDRLSHEQKHTSASAKSG